MTPKNFILSTLVVCGYPEQVIFLLPNSLTLAQEEYLPGRKCIYTDLVRLMFKRLDVM